MILGVVETESGVLKVGMIKTSQFKIECLLFGEAEKAALRLISRGNATNGYGPLCGLICQQ